MEQAWTAVEQIIILQVQAGRFKRGKGNFYCRQLCMEVWIQTSGPGNTANNSD